MQQKIKVEYIHNLSTSIILFSSVDNLDGGGWKLVRHVPEGSHWHPATDHLLGSDKYGTPSGPLSKKAWSIQFNKECFNQFLFATGLYLK